MTEAELLQVFRAAAARHLARPDVAADAGVWIDQRLAEAAAQAAGDPRLDDPLEAARRADRFLDALLPPPPGPLKGFRAPPQVHAGDLARAAALGLPWPFGTEP
jgi:hypothetical protein